MDYYRQSYCCSENLAITRPNIGLSGLEAVNDTIKWNHDYIEVADYKKFIHYCGHRV